MATANNYVLGRGKVFFDRFAPGTLVSEKGERFFGNCPEFSTSASADTLDHYSSTGGMKVKDASVDLQINRTGTFTCDNINGQNVALFFSGTATDVVQAASTGATEALTLYKGRYYQLGKTAANPAGVRRVTNLVIETTGGTPVTVAAAGNYEFDAARGRLYVLDDATDIVDGTEYDFTYDLQASTGEVVVSENSTIYGAIRFVADNATGENRDYYLPYVKLSPNGDYSLIGDDWQTIGFNMEILKLDDATESMYITDIPVLTP